MRGMFERTTGSEVNRQAARIGSAPFLLPETLMRPPSGRPPSITNDPSTYSLTAVVVTASGILPAVSAPTREQAWETLIAYTASEALRRHALAVEASSAWYVRALG